MFQIKRNGFRDWLARLPVVLDALLSVAFCAAGFVLFALVFSIPLDRDWIRSSAITTVVLVAYGLWLRRVYRRQHGMDAA